MPVSEKNLSFYEQKALRLGKKLFIESSPFSVKPEQVDNLQESSDRGKLIESRDGRKVHLLAILKNVPLTRFVINNNNRRYRREVWIKVYHEGTAEGSSCLDGHPNDEAGDDGLPSNIVGVWKNFRVNKDNCTADLYMNNTEKARAILYSILNGTKVGLSSVGYGELEENNIDVCPDSFVVERASDFVLSPSQQVFATFENIDESSLSESTTEDTNRLTEVSTNSKYVVIEGTENLSSLHQSKLHLTKEEVVAQQPQRKTQMPEAQQQTNSILISLTRNNAKAVLKEAKKAIKEGDLKSLQEAHRDLDAMTKDFPTDSSLDGLRDEMYRADRSVQEAMEKEMEESQKIEEEHEDLKKKYESAVGIAESLKDRCNKMQKVIEGLGGSPENMEKMHVLEEIQDDMNRLLEDRARLIADNKKFIVERKAVFGDMNKILPEREKMLKHINFLLEDSYKRDRDIDIFMMERTRVLKEAKQLLSDRTLMSKDLKEAYSTISLMQKDLKQMREDRQTLKALVRKYKEKLIEASDEMERDPYDEVYATQKGLGDSIFPVETESGDQELGQTDPAFLDNASLMKHTDRISESRDTGTHMTRGKRVSGRIKENVDPDIKWFYNREVGKYPSLKMIESRIKGANSLLEATRIVDNFLDDSSGDDFIPNKFSESIANKPSIMESDESWTSNRL